MNVQFIGDDRLFTAVESLLFQLKEVRLYSVDINSDDFCKNIHALILDSKWFREFTVQSTPRLAYKVVVIGPYIDDCSKSSFTTDPQYTYLAYSELESKLPPLLDSLLFSCEEGRGE